MKIQDYPEISELSSGDKLVVETPDGTKKIDGSNIGKSDGAVTLDPVVLHRNTYRGKNLGSSFTAEQKDAIANGTFDDLYIGDYWNINGVTWRIADIDYWYGNFTENLNKITSHHLVMFPDMHIATGQMHTTNKIYNVGYIGSTFNTTTVNSLRSIIKSAFGDNLLKIYFSAPSSVDSYSTIETDVFLPMSYMISNSSMIGNKTNKSIRDFLHQDPIFEMMSLFKFNNRILIDKDTYEYGVYNRYWTGDVIFPSSSSEDGGFGMVMLYGKLYWDWASANSVGFRPMFCLKGE